MRYQFNTIENIFPDQIGIWLWPQRPVTVRHVGEYDKTYFGFVDNTGKAYVASLNHDTEDYDLTFMYDWQTQDDHNQPSLHVRNDGRIIVFIGGHNEPNIYYKISTTPEDITSFGEMKTLQITSGGYDYSYPQPVELSDERRIYLFYRRAAVNEPGYRVWGVAISEDDGETFVENDNAIFADVEAQSPYTTPVGNGKDKIWFARSDWMLGKQSYVRKDINVCYYYQDAFYKADGTKIKDWAQLPIVRNEMELVFDSAENGKHAYVSDIALDDNDNPHIAFTALEMGTNNDGTYDGNGMNYYEYAMYDGTEWSQETITEAGSDILSGMATHPAYNGGLMLNFDNPNEVVMGREVGGFKSKIFRIELWRRIEGQWKMTNIITDEKNGETKVFRPYIPRNHHPDMKVLWSGGRYDHYTNFDTNIYRSKPFSYKWL